MQEYLLNQVKEKFPKQVEFYSHKSTRSRHVYAVRTSEDRLELFNKLKTFLSNLKDLNGNKVTVLEKFDIGVSKSVPLLLVTENNIQYAFVAKPLFSSRAASGSITQSKLSKFLSEELGLKVVSSAGLSQNIQDITFEINNVKEGMEIKGTANHLQKIATFDKSVARSGLGLITRTDDTPIQEVVKALMTEHNVKLKGTDNPLTQYIDFIRQSDKSVGFPGDEGVKTSGGKLDERYFYTSNGITINKILTVINKHFAANKDNYFVIFNTALNKFFICNTEYGTSFLKNLPLGSKIIEFNNKAVLSAGIGLYGTLGQKGRIRLAIYLKFNPNIITSHLISYEL